MSSNPSTGSYDAESGSLPNQAPLPDLSSSLILLRSAQQGDRRSLDELIRRYEPRLRRIVRARLSPSLAARIDESDIVDLTLHAASRQLAGFEPENAASLLHWLSTIATRKIRDELDRLHAAKRDVGREVALSAFDGSSSGPGWQPAARDLSPSMALFRKELEELFDAAVSLLPDDQREVVILRDYCHHAWDDIARLLSRTSPHAASQLHQRAWIALRRTLGPKLRDCR